MSIYLDYSSHFTVQKIDAPIVVGEFSHFILTHFILLYLLFSTLWMASVLCEQRYPSSYYHLLNKKKFPMDLWLCKLIREQYKCFVIFSPLYAYLWTFQELPYQKLWAFFKCYGIHTSFMLYIWFFQFISLSVFDLNFCMKFGNSCSMLPSKSVAHWPSARLWFD